MAHGNARLTFHGRLLIVRRYEAGWRQAQIAEAMGVSRQCVGKWIRRHADEGRAGLHDRSSRPHRMPNKTPAQVEQRVLAARRRHRRGQDWIGPRVGVAPRTVARILRRHGVAYLRDCDPMTGEVIRASKVTAVRYERDRPGDLVHMDVKKLGRIPDGGGWRSRGQTRRNHQSRVDKTPIGYDFVHSVVDDHSRLAYSEIHPDETGVTCAGFLERAIAAFADHGIVAIRQLMTDNAWAYRFSLREVCSNHGIEQIFIKPHCPWQNGKVERFNRTLTTEWAYRHPYTHNLQRQAALAPWLHDYNTARGHSSLGGHPPISRMPPT